MEHEGCAKELNDFLVEVFNDILKTEELYVTERCADLSVREMHLIEEVCRAVDEGRDNRSSVIAAAQRVTAVSVKRSVRLCPTEKGREANRRHTDFHRELVAATVETLTPEETEVLVRGLSGIAAFIRAKYLA